MPDNLCFSRHRVRRSTRIVNYAQALTLFASTTGRPENSHSPSSSMCCTAIAFVSLIFASNGSDFGTEPLTG